MLLAVAKHFCPDAVPVIETAIKNPEPAFKYLVSQFSVALGFQKLLCVPELTAVASTCQKHDNSLVFDFIYFVCRYC